MSNDIASLNDRFRSNFGFCEDIPGQVVITAGIHDLPPDDKAAVLNKVRDFKTFKEDNDPYGEHDFGAFKHAGERIYWKLDYYAPDMQHGSDDPIDLSKTVRVLTILLASEW